MTAINKREKRHAEVRYWERNLDIKYFLKRNLFLHPNIIKPNLM